MTHAQFLSIKKLTGKNIIEVAAQHNHREISEEKMACESNRHINPERIRLNRVLRGHGTAATVSSAAQKLMDDAGVKALRKDAVRALEIIFSVSPHSLIDHERFFNESVEWAEHYLGAPVISAIVHNDEAAPHCHVLLLPLVGGRMIGSDLMGGRSKLQALQADFHAKVGLRHGLIRKAVRKRSSAATRQQAIDSAFDVLKVNSGLSDDVLRALLAPHVDDPEPLLLALNLSMPTPAAAKGEFVKTMTKPCKPEKPIGFRKKKPIGFDGCDALEKEQTLSCVGFANSTPSFPLNESPLATQNQPPAPAIAITEIESFRREGVGLSSMSSAAKFPLQASVTKDSQTTGGEGDHTRERDDEQPAGLWSAELGEFIKPAVKSSCKHAVIASVRVALESIMHMAGGGDGEPARP